MCHLIRQRACNMYYGVWRMNIYTDNKPKTANFDITILRSLEVAEERREKYITFHQKTEICTIDGM